MKILTSDQIRDADQHTIENEPISSIDLMERASIAFSKEITEYMDMAYPVCIFCGTGNNGGDGLAVARILAEMNYDVSVYILNSGNKPSTDFSTNRTRLEKETSVKVVELDNLLSNFPELNPDEYLIDALWGSGLSRSIEGIGAQLIGKINSSNCFTIALDIPSGLYADKPSSSNIVQADLTVGFQLPKLAFIMPENYPFVGEWLITDIGLDSGFLASQETKYHLFTIGEATQLIPYRDKFEHKGHFGHVMIIAGSKGKSGAASLCAKACLRSGAGLVTAHVPAGNYGIMQTSVPEVMVSVDKDQKIWTETPSLEHYKVIAIGPGIGTDDETFWAFQQLLEQAEQPLIIDADGINLLAKDLNLLKKLPPGSILTPHPGEFKKIAGEWKNGFEKIRKAETIASEHNIYIVLKGAHTVIVSPENEIWFNDTGNPGMATAGSGDVLTGIIAGFMSQGLSPLDSTRLGVCLHGLAGDSASLKTGEIPLIATDIINHLGNAIKLLSQ